IYRRKSEDFLHKGKDGWGHEYRTCKKMANKPPAPYRTGTQKSCRKSNSKTWLTKGEKVIYAFLCAAIIACGMFIVSYASTTDTLNRETQTLNDEVNAQKVENENLLFEVRELSKPERITKVAKDNGLEIQEAQVKQAAN